MWLDKITEKNRDAVIDLIGRLWHSTVMVVRGESVDMSAAEGFVILDGQDIVGLVTYRVSGGDCEILSLDSLKEGVGIGTRLVDEVERTALASCCRRIILITTNDNTHALRFYQRRGFDIIGFYRNALDRSRHIKPSIPLTGCDGIPIRHEIELAYLLDA